MKKHTDFTSINELLNICGIQNLQDLKNKISTLDEIINQRSEFKNFEDMKICAVKEHYRNQIMNSLK